MKKFLLLIIVLSGLFSVKAQMNEKSEAIKLIAKNSNAIGLSDQDLKNSIVSDTYIDKIAGTRMVYLQQSYKGIPVYNKLQVLAFKNDMLVSNAGSRIQSIEKLVNIRNAVPVVSPSLAVLAAISDRKLTATQPALILDTRDDGRMIEFSDMGVSRENITAQLMWVPVMGGRIRLSWQVYIIQNNSPDYWVIRVDAINNKIIDINNLTVYDNWDLPANKSLSNLNAENLVVPSTSITSGFFDLKSYSVVNNSLPLSPLIINSASYLVVPYPAESPIHPGGTPALRTDPWTAAPGNATSLKWNSTGISDYTITRGNNVWAKEDRAGTNGTGQPATSTTPDPLTFNFTPNFTVTPTQTTPVKNQQFNITNLFYWNNIIHDITYQYGFDEVSGNFQANNQGRGGAGNDYVLADAQDGGGTNNANFATPADGGSGRMQMYLWSGTPQKDGDVDNGVVSHEFAHGISNRLTGGPSQANCLGNAEQMGEGWSDYYGLMYTQDWANSNLNSGFSSPRGVGTYVINQPITGTGIRSQKYCTNFAINNKVYATSISAESHNRGEIWCATLWDMTWNIINQVGSINPNLYDAAGGGGNTIALKLVTEGLKLQPCSPGFIDGRNAILQADQVLYGGLYSCAIREAFRRRGMGAFASQGSSSSVTDQVPDFSPGSASLLLTQNGLTAVPEGQNITYTNTVSNGPCAPLTNFLLTDTLPANVTYLSGGTYNSATRVVSFPVNLTTGQTQTYSFTVTVNTGAYHPTITLFEDAVTTPTVPPATWTTTTTSSANWAVSGARSHSAPSSYYSSNLDVQSDERLFSTNAIALGPNPPLLSFWHWYSAESTYDGGVLEISTNGGTVWTDARPNIISGGYTGTMDASTLLAGRQAWTGSSNGNFIKTKVNLIPYANQSIKMRFRFTSDVGTNLEGWYVDDIAIKDQAVVEMRSSLFNSSNVRVAISDSIAIILPPVSCTNVAVATPPANQNVCVGSNATFSVAVDGTTPTYQWQMSTDGVNFTNIAGATSATLTLPAVTASMNNNSYQVIVSNSCPSNITSGAATLLVGNPATITTQPTGTTVCAGNDASFSITASGSANTYQWQVSTDGGNTFTDIAGAISSTFTVTQVTGAMNNNQYHVVVGSCGGPLNSSNVVLTVNTPAAIATQPASTTACLGTDATLTVTATGTSLTYQWQVSTDGGITFNPIPGATSPGLTLTAVTAGMSNNVYNVIINGICPSAITSANAVLTVSNIAAVTSQPVNTIACVGNSVSIVAVASGLSYQWQVSTDGGITFTDIPGATTTTLDLVGITASMNNNQYHLVVFSCGAASIVSNPAILTVNEPAGITTQPVNTIVCLGADATFTVTATGTSVSYQWEVSTDGGISFTPISGANTASLTITNVTAALDNNLYRVVLSNSCTVNFTSSPALLSITTAPVINTQPANTNACENSIASFAVVAAGTGVTYQWQVSSDGGATFTNIPAETNVSLSITSVTAVMDNNQYRVIVFNACSTTGIISNAATLTVLPLPIVTISASPYSSLTENLSTVLTATSTPASNTYTWYKDGVLLSSVTGNTLTLNHNALGEYNATVTDASGCTGSSNRLTISDSSMNIAFITPNPNTGHFQVRFKGTGLNGQPRIITMYDAKGSRVYSKSFVTSISYEPMDVHAEKLGAAVYVLILSDVQGNTLGIGKVVIL